MPIKWKIWLLNRCNNIRIDKDVILRENIIFAKRGITIKKGSLVNRGVLFLSTFPNSSILIEENVYVGPNCSLICNSHNIGSSEKRAKGNLSGNISIGKGCWLGANVTVLPGISIAEGCVIGAGAVVSKNTERDGLYVGVPARRIKNL